MSMTTLAKVKRTLNIPTGVTQHDDYLTDLVSEVDQEILSFVGMPLLTLNNWTDKFDIGDDTHEIALRVWPVVSVAAVTESGSLVSADDYYVDNEVGYIRLTETSRVFDTGRQKVEVTYTAGHTTIPADLTRAATVLCCEHFNTDRHAGLFQEHMGTYKYQADQKTIYPRSVKRVLQAYLRAVV